MAFRILYCTACRSMARWAIFKRTGTAGAGHLLSQLWRDLFVIANLDWTLVNYLIVDHAARFSR